MNELLFKDTWNDEEREEARSLKGPILIIGASGFIGSKLFFSLIQLRNDVYAASRSINSSWRFLKLPAEARSGNFFELDITDHANVLDLFRKIKPGTVFNLSAYGSSEDQNDPAEIHKVNYLGTLNIIRALQDSGCDAFVQAGSSSEYGLNCAGPNESSALMPNSDYSVSKGAASLLISYYGKIKNLPVVNLRLYSVYGPFETKTRLIPKIVDFGRQGNLPPFADGTISRDFVYVDDCTNAFVKAALTACKTDPGLSINIGTGRKTTLKEVSQIAKELFNVSSEPVFGAMKNRKWDLSNWFANTTLAQEKLGWKARVDFRSGLRLTQQWASEVAQSALATPDRYS